MSNQSRTYLDVVDDVGRKKITNRYNLNRPGLFVLIINQRFGYEDPSAPSNWWNDLDYSTEEGKWKKLIPGKHLKIVGRNLRAEPTEDKPKAGNSDSPYYEDFLENLKDRIKKEKPSFVFVYIASHGDADGNFLLSSHPKWNANRQKWESDKRMCSDDCNPKDGHSYKTLPQFRSGHPEPGFRCCHKRNLDVLVAEIQNIEDETGKKVLSGVPKIFIAQICRGVREDKGEEKYLSSNDGQNVPVVYTVPDADTLRFYSTLAGHKSWVPTGCSLLLDKLYKVLLGFHSDHNESTPCISKNEMKRLRKRIAKSKFSRETKLSTDRWIVEVEDVVHGWITDVFTTVCNELGLKMGIVDRNVDTHEIEERKDKQVPEYHSSLTLKLSALEMFRHEYPA